MVVLKWARVCGQAGVWMDRQTCAAQPQEDPLQGCVCECLRGVLESRGCNGPTPSLCEVLQENLKQRVVGGGVGMIRCWRTSWGNSRYAVGAGWNPHGCL